MPTGDSSSAETCSSRPRRSEFYDQLVVSDDLSLGGWALPMPTEGRVLQPDQLVEKLEPERHSVIAPHDTLITAHVPGTVCKPTISHG